MILIGLGNKARQGKDTFAQAVLDYYGGQRDLQQLHDLPVTAPKAQRVGFADALYEVAKTEYGMTEKDAPLLQRIGHERRQQDPKYWIKKAFEKFFPSTNIGVITDVRYRNEAEEIKKQGGYVVNITRKVGAGNYITNDRPTDHPSEIDLDGYPFDFYLVNSNGHEALLAQQAVCLVEYLRGLHS
jgi:hypothetical protein